MTITTKMTSRSALHAVTLSPCHPVTLSPLRPFIPRTAGAEAAAGDRAGAEALEGGVVLGGGVALVAGEAVAGVGGVERHHQPVARDFGDDGRSGDGDAAEVTLHDGLVGARETLDGQAVDERD